MGMGDEKMARVDDIIRFRIILRMEPHWVSLTKADKKYAVRVL